MDSAVGSSASNRTQHRPQHRCPRRLRRDGSGGARDACPGRGRVIATTAAEMRRLDPEAYLRHVIEHIAEHPINRIDELLPWAVADTLRVEHQQRLAA